MQKQHILLACILLVSILFINSCSMPSLPKIASDDEDKTTQVDEADAPDSSQDDNADEQDDNADEQDDNADEQDDNADEQDDTASDDAAPSPIAAEEPDTNHVVVPAEDWQTYVNDNYGFSFRYPSTWTMRKGKDNVIKLVQNTLTLVIRYRSINEETVINSGGVAAGDFETRGMVTFLGEEITRVVLVYEGLDKAVLYNATAEIQAGDLVFTIRFEDLDEDYDAIVIPKAFQAEVDGIVSSFAFTDSSVPAASEQGEDTVEVAESNPETAEGWVGLIKSNPVGSQYDDYFETADGTRYGIVAQDPLSGERLAMLRDTGSLAYVWGKIHYNVLDVNSTQIRVIRIETDQTQEETAQAQPPGAEPTPEETTIAFAMPPDTQLPPQSGNQSGASQPPATNDSWREQDTEDSAPENPDPALGDSWTGQFESYPRGAQIGYRFNTDDGQSFTLNSMESNIMEQIEQLRWQDARVQVWGQVLTNVPMGPQIQVDRIKVLEEASMESRNLMPFATPSASSELPSDEWGSYYVEHSIDTVLETSWVEGSAGSGVGEWIMLTFPGRFTIERISMSVGFDRDDDIFFANNRVKRATLSFSNGDDVTLDFADARGMQSKPIPRVRGKAVETSFVKITIDEIYPGARYNDTCVAEIEVWGKVDGSAVLYSLQP